jgi:hypothetical protein
MEFIILPLFLAITSWLTYKSYPFFHRVLSDTIELNKRSIEKNLLKQELKERRTRLSIEQQRFAFERHQFDHNLSANTNIELEKLRVQMNNRNIALENDLETKKVALLKSLLEIQVSRLSSLSEERKLEEEKRIQAEIDSAISKIQSDITGSLSSAF